MLEAHRFIAMRFILEKPHQFFTNIINYPMNSQSHALYEIQQLFPRQKWINFIEAFIGDARFMKKEVAFGEDVVITSLSIFTPDRVPYYSRSFEGSDLSAVTIRNYNQLYGIIAVLIKLWEFSKSSKIAREIVRALAINLVKQTALHMDRLVEIPEVNPNTVCFLERDHLYCRLFNPSEIWKCIRSKYRRKILSYHYALSRRKINCDSNFDIRKELINTCSSSGLSCITSLLAHIDEVQDSAVRQDAFKGIFFFLESLICHRRSTFYKNLEGIFDNSHVKQPVKKSSRKRR